MAFSNSAKHIFRLRPDGYMPQGDTIQQLLTSTGTYGDAEQLATVIAVVQDLALYNVDAALHYVNRAGERLVASQLVMRVLATKDASSGAIPLMSGIVLRLLGYYMHTTNRDVLPTAGTLAILICTECHRQGQQHREVAGEAHRILDIFVIDKYSVICTPSVEMCAVVLAALIAVGAQAGHSGLLAQWLVQVGVQAVTALELALSYLDMSQQVCDVLQEYVVQYLQPYNVEAGQVQELVDVIEAHRS